MKGAAAKAISTGDDVVIVTTDDFEEDFEPDEAVAEEFEIDDDALAEDDGHATHNHAVALSLWEAAIEAVQKKEVTFTNKQAQEVMQILPCVGVLNHFQIP